MRERGDSAGMVEGSMAIGFKLLPDLVIVLIVREVGEMICKWKGKNILDTP